MDYHSYIKYEVLLIATTGSWLRTVSSIFRMKMNSKPKATVISAPSLFFYTDIILISEGIASLTQFCISNKAIKTFIYIFKNGFKRGGRGLGGAPSLVCVCLCVCV